jgi:hypothetical protein
MLRMNHWTVIVAAVAAVVASMVWYTVFGAQYMALRGMAPATTANMAPPFWGVLAELARTLVVAYVLGRFVVRLGVVDWLGAVRLGLWVWLGFQAMLLAGSIIHENYPLGLYAIHAGDALVKTLLMSVIFAVWPKARKE